jgi:hypothetical protein
MADTSMSRNIVVCCDGTANEFAQRNTNVVKLYATLLHDPTRQVTYYHPGLGTMEPAGAMTNVGCQVTKILGLGMGYGLASDIRDAYVFVMNNFRDSDQLFLFGFSRGAYTARAVASLLRLPYRLPPLTRVCDGARRQVLLQHGQSPPEFFHFRQQRRSVYTRIADFTAFRGTVRHFALLPSAGLGFSIRFPSGELTQHWASATTQYGDSWHRSICNSAPAQATRSSEHTKDQ